MWHAGHLLQLVSVSDSSMALQTLEDTTRAAQCAALLPSILLADLPAQELLCIPVSDYAWLLLLLAAGAATPPKVVLMSATADSQLFANYFKQAGPEALLLGQTAVPGLSRQPQQQRLGLSVGMLSIPGFTHPVRQLWLEDALQATGIIIGKQSR